MRLQRRLRAERLCHRRRLLRCVPTAGFHFALPMQRLRPRAINIHPRGSPPPQRRRSPASAPTPPTPTTGLILCPTPSKTACKSQTGRRAGLGLMREASTQYATPSPRRLKMKKWPRLGIKSCSVSVLQESISVHGLAPPSNKGPKPVGGPTVPRHAPLLGCGQGVPPPRR